MFVLYDHDTHTNVHEKGIMHWRRWRVCGVESLVWFLAATHSPTLFGWASASVQPKSLADKVKTPVWLVDPASIEAWRLEFCRCKLHLSERFGRRQPVEPKQGFGDSNWKLARRPLTPQRDVLALCRWLRCISEAGSLSWEPLVSPLPTWRPLLARGNLEGCAETLMKAKDGWRRLGLEDRISALGARFTVN